MIVIKLIHAFNNHFLAYFRRLIAKGQEAEQASDDKEDIKGHDDAPLFMIILPSLGIGFYDGDLPPMFLDV